MLGKTAATLEKFYKNEPLRGSDGQLHDMDGVTRIDRRQTERLAELHRSIKPDLSVETGLAYGFSSLPMLDAMEELGYGHHVAIDPGQVSYWHGVALTTIEDLGFSKRFTWMDARSDEAFPRLIAEGKRAQFIFFDGVHTFDGVVTDLVLADQLLDVGGLLVLNNTWLPAIRATASFITSNLAHYDVVAAEHENIFIFRKARPDERSWDHFVPFDSAGLEQKKPKGVFAKLLGSG